MRTKNVQAELDTNDILQIPRDIVRRADQYLRHGDVLISSANSWNLVGRCSWVPELTAPAAIGGFVTALRVTSDRLDSRYLYRWFSSARTQAEVRNNANQTTNIANLNLKRCEALRIPLPSLDEQRRIAAVLDHADDLRAKRRRVDRSWEQLVSAIFDELFGNPIVNSKGWPVHSFGDLASSMQYGPRFYNESYSPEGIRIVRITDLDYSGRLDFGSMPRMAVTEDDTGKFGLSAGDILFARTGATVGKLALIKESDPPCIAGAYFIRIQLKECLEPTFAAAFLRSRPIQAIIEAGSHQSAQQNFSGPGLRALPCPLPPIELQQQFGRLLEKLEAHRAPRDEAGSAFDELFASLQSRAFSGQL